MTWFEYFAGMTFMAGTAGMVASAVYVIIHRRRRK